MTLDLTEDETQRVVAALELLAQVDQQQEHPLEVLATRGLLHKIDRAIWAQAEDK